MVMPPDGGGAPTLCSPCEEVRLVPSGLGSVLGYKTSEPVLEGAVRNID
ncbi:MAG: hypothetical protein LC799_32670 [Actinobacteria bacterium]|nr:hypothetical protein [Actinomycetota bacterium]